MPEIKEDTAANQANHRRKVLRAKEQKKKLKLKKLAKRIKKVENKQKPILRKQLEDLSQRNKRKEEQHFDVIFNTITNSQKTRKREMSKRLKEREIKKRLVESGVLEGKNRMCSKHKLDARELMDLPIGTHYALFRIRDIRNHGICFPCNLQYTNTQNENHVLIGILASKLILKI